MLGQLPICPGEEMSLWSCNGDRPSTRKQHKTNLISSRSETGRRYFAETVCLERHLRFADDIMNHFGGISAGRNAEQLFKTSGAGDEDRKGENNA